MLNRLLIVVLILMLPGCTHQQNDTPEAATRSFYQQYLQAFANFDPADASHSPLADDSPLLRKFVSSGTRFRIAEIHQIYEQEILEADYFTYCQDYAPEWIEQLEVGKAVMQPGGAVLPVYIGIGETKPLQLMVWLRQEDKSWKIYRVRDVTHNYEQHIFDDAAIKAARASSR
ncbi:YbjP/YqhG family protein [Enterobacter cancerogenus]|uniref:YbjP/YqhG family protein n=1 Tax=Enterobacter cancerogenus TaxID=69218 RepID=UPI0030762A26